MKVRIRPIEIFLFQVIIYLALWLLYDYLASLLSLLFGILGLLILIISLIVEWIERSKVPRWYFLLMLATVLAPLAAAGLFFVLGGEVSWLSN